jgi:hypothetical protein
MVSILHFDNLLPPTRHAGAALQNSALAAPQSGAGPATDPPKAPYGVLVSLRMRRQDLSRFFQIATTLRAEYATGGLILQLSGWDVRTEDARSAAPLDRRGGAPLQPREVEMFNLWRLKDDDADSLRTAMEYLYDVIDYYLLGALELAEYKALGVRFADGDNPRRADAPQPKTAEEAKRPQLPAGQRYVYVRTTNLVLTPNLAEFRARLGAYLPAVREETGWYGGDAYLGITGLPNIVTQVWIVPEGSYARFNSQLARAPWDSLLQTAPTYDVFQPSPFDPLLGVE